MNKRTYTFGTKLLTDVNTLASDSHRSGAFTTWKRNRLSWTNEPNMHVLYRASPVKHVFACRTCKSANKKVLFENSLTEAVFLFQFNPASLLEKIDLSECNS